MTDPVQVRGIRANRRASLGAEIVQAKASLDAIPKDLHHMPQRDAALGRLVILRDRLRRMEVDHADR